MSWTKRQIISAALQEIGLSSYIFDFEADQLQSYVRRLDMMMATWDSMGIHVGYPLPGVDYDASDLDTETGLADTAIEAVTTNLALALATSIGRTPMMDTRVRAKAGLTALQGIAAIPQQRQFPATLPRGQGQRHNRVCAPFFPNPEDPLTTAEDGEIEF